MLYIRDSQPVVRVPLVVRGEVPDGTQKSQKFCFFPKTLTCVTYNNSVLTKQLEGYKLLKVFRGFWGILSDWLKKPNILARNKAEHIATVFGVCTIRTASSIIPTNNLTVGGKWSSFWFQIVETIHWDEKSPDHSICREFKNCSFRLG